MAPGIGLEGDEGLPWRAPSARLLVLRRLEVAVLTVAAALLGVIVAGVYVRWLVGIAVGVLAAALGLVAERVVTRRYIAWGYAEREDDLLVRRGVAFTRLSVVPYGRMQFVDVAAGPIERAFGMATVELHTATPATDAKIPGLTPDEAGRLRDRLSALGQAQAWGL